MLALEEAGFYNGYYFVLGRILLAPLESGTSIDLPGLNARLCRRKIEEITPALGSTTEGANTATWLLPVGCSVAKILVNSCFASGLWACTPGLWK